MAIGWTFREPGPPPRPAPPPYAPPARIGYVALVAVMTLFVLALPRSYAAFLDTPSARPQGAHLALPAAGAAWTADPVEDNWHPHFATADFTVKQGFRDGMRRVDLFIAYYIDQNPDKKLLAFANKIGGGDEWDISNRSSATLTIDGEKVPVAVEQYNWGARKRLIYSVYWTGGGFETSPLKVKLLQAKAELTDGNPAAAIIAFATDITEDNQTAAATLADFAAHLQALRPALRPVTTP
jgi:EpsI family protein